MDSHLLKEFLFVLVHLHLLVVSLYLVGNLLRLHYLIAYLQVLLWCLQKILSRNLEVQEQSQPRRE